MTCIIVFKREVLSVVFIAVSFYWSMWIFMVYEKIFSNQKVL